MQHVAQSNVLNTAACKASQCDITSLCAMTEYLQHCHDKNFLGKTLAGIPTEQRIINFSFISAALASLPHHVSA